MSDLTKEQREALHRCYQLLLSLPGPDPGETEPEDADEFADQAASPGSASVTETESNSSLPDGSPPSSAGCDSGGGV